MANLTLTIDDESLQKARLRALTQGTSVNAVVREFLEAYAGVRSEQEDAVRRLIEMSRKARSKRGGRTWTRDELHER